MTTGRPRPLVLDVSALFAPHGGEALRTTIGALAADSDRFATRVRIDRRGIHAVPQALLAKRLRTLASADPSAALRAWLLGQGPRPGARPPRRRLPIALLWPARAVAGVVPRDALLFATGLDGNDDRRAALVRARPDITMVPLIDSVAGLDWPDYESEPLPPRLAALASSAAAIVVPDRGSRDRLATALGAGPDVPPLAIVAPPALSGDGPFDEGLARADYCLAIDPIEGGTNTALLLHVWRDLLGAGGPVPKLVLAGVRGAEIEEIKPLLGWNETIRAHVVEAPGLSPTSLARFVRHARAVLAPAFASRTPWLLAEAAALGTPLIVADHLEAPPQARRFSPIDGPAWRAAVRATPPAVERPPIAGRPRLDPLAALLALAAAV